MRNQMFLALSVLAMIGMTIAASAEDREKCYGVARAGKNDGTGSTDSAGSSKVNYQGDAWIWIDAGKCQTFALPPQPDGTPRRGSLEPLDRDAP